MDEQRDIINVNPPAEPAPQAETSGGSSIPDEELERITGDVIKSLKTVYDPEIPVDIFELGLIYKVDLNDDRLLTIDMTLTAPGCPVAGEMPGWVEGAVRGVEGVEDAFGGAVVKTCRHQHADGFQVVHVRPVP